MPRPALLVHGGAGAPPESEYPIRDAAVERAADAGWAALSRPGARALDAVIAAVRHMEDEPSLNAGIGACLNLDGVVELDAAVMDGRHLRVGAVAAVRDIRHPVDGARAVMDEGRHVLLVADGASRFARERGLPMTPNDTFITDRQRRNLTEALARREIADTVGAVAVDGDGHVAVAVSTGGVYGKWPGRVGDSPLAGAGFWADDRAGAVCATGQGEGFIRTALCHLAAVELEQGMDAAEVARRAIDHLARRVAGSGGLILVTPGGEIAMARNTPYMATAGRT